MPQWRNIYTYVLGVFLLSAVGGGLLYIGQSIGGLIFVISPVLVATILRLATKEGWRNAGLRPNLRGNVGFYLVAVAAFPTIIGLIVVCGQLMGMTTIASDFWIPYVASIPIVASTTMLFAASEEFGWRGYLDPQLEELGVMGLRRHLLVGLIWGIWHFPYVIGLGDYTVLPFVVFAPLFLVATIAMAVWYGVVRQRTDSVWPAVVAHGVGNATIWPLVTNDSLQIDAPLVFAPRPDALLMCGLLIALAAVLWRTSQTSPTVVLGSNRTVAPQKGNAL